MKKTEKTALTAAMFAAVLNFVPLGTANEADENANNALMAAAAEEFTGTTTTATEGFTTVYDPPWVLNGTTANDNTTTTVFENEDVVTRTENEMMGVYGPPPAVPGDVTLDGRVDSFDMAELRKIVTNGDSELYYKDMNADVNGDGKIGISDLVMLQQYLLGKTVNFNNKIPEPIEPTMAPVYGPPSFFN